MSNYGEGGGLPDRGGGAVEAFNLFDKQPPFPLS